ncbi:MAG: NCS2 family permease [Erysipelotrichaceae bacterium]|nr:NCS2 family permease [Erysipelotrichaceae bacterium]
MLENYFKLEENGTNVKTEILAGLTTFLSMAYILGVNPGILSDAGMDFNAVFVATAFAAGIASIFMGLVANYPVALASGMGVNALFTYTIVLQMGLSYKGALACVLVSGIVFLIISVTGIRRLIINAMPQQLKLAIGAGIGFFVAFVGLKNAGIIISNEATLVGLGNFKDPAVLLALFGIVVTLVLLARNTPAAVFYGLVVTAVIGVIAGIAGVPGMPELPKAVVSFNLDFSLFGAVFEGLNELLTHPQCFTAIFTLLFVDFFDTAGTLVAVAGKTNLMTEDGELKNVERALLADAVGTVAGAVLGTSTVTSFVESASGVGVGGRTGLTAVTTGVLFILSVFFSPLLVAVTYAVTAPALVIVGILMAQQLAGIEWDNIAIAAATFVTISFMMLGYSISNGLALGFIVYGVAMLVMGKTEEVSPIIWALVIIFILYFAFLI